MGSCASVNQVSKPTATPLHPHNLAPILWKSTKPELESKEEAQLYHSYPYSLNIASVELLKGKYPNEKFVEYYDQKVERRKRTTNLRDTLLLHTYDHPSISTSAPSFLKEKLMEAIRDNDKQLLHNTFDEGIGPNESIGKPGYGETVLHYLAARNSYEVLVNVLEWVKKSQPQKLSFYLNIPDSEGNTPLMVCGICDTPEALSAFFQSEPNVDYDLKNNAGLTLLEICKYFSSRCETIVSQFQAQASSTRAIGGDNGNSSPNLLDLTVIPSKTKTASKLQSTPSTTYSEKDLSDLRAIPGKREEISTTLEQIELKHQALIARLAEASKEFKDTEFSATDSSIGYRKIEVNMWKKDHEIVEKEKGTVKIFGKVNPFDVLPGIQKTIMAGVIKRYRFCLGISRQSSIRKKLILKECIR